ncbi:hypothetical protein CHARACLAT_026467 [Characodon lateralis]|uniref:PDEase domain-containing protein n=1 Tax=Characodon lateralis TaxID=208331 RepID=A0ABU7CTU1_9TELE|nr:hypothetical protein [Characodon lateralis]
MILSLSSLTRLFGWTGHVFLSQSSFVFQSSPWVPTSVGPHLEGFSMGSGLQSSSVGSPRPWPTSWQSSPWVLDSPPLPASKVPASQPSSKAIITLILATDMARHGEILDGFKQKVDHFDFTNEEHVLCLKRVLIKCCDISNEVRPTEVAEPWVDCLLEEYFMQSDREKSEGLPVAPFMDRDKVTKPTAQIGFIKFVLIPMFETVMKLFPQIEEIMVQPLRDSRDHYEELKQLEDSMTEESSVINRLRKDLKSE